MKLILATLLLALSFVPSLTKAKSSEMKFRSWPIGEKSYQTPALTYAQYSLNLAQMENQFFVLEINESYDLKKHSPIFEIKTDSEAPFEITLSWLLGHKVSGSQFAEDIVIPMHQENLHQLPKENFSHKKMLLVEIKAKLLNAPAQWKGNLIISRIDNKTEIQIPLEVKIHKYVLPAEFHLQTSIGFAPWTVFKKHNVSYALEDDLYKKYYSLAREHRIDMHKLYVEFPKSDDNVLKNATNSQHSFLNVWQNAKGADATYTNMQLTDLPVPEQYKSDNPRNEKFWRSLNNETKGNKSFFVYFDDEPTPEKIKKMLPTLKAIKTWAPDLKIMLTTNWTKELDSLIQIWCPNLIFWNLSGYPSQKKYEELTKNGDNTLWIYVSCNSHGCSKGHNEVTGLSDLIINRPASYTYSFPWAAEAVGASGILYYDSVRGYQENDKSPWLDPMLFNGMGEGNLFYPCPKSVCSTSAPEVFPSLRLKILQGALQSLEIYKNALLKDRKILKSREAVIRSPHLWSKKIADYDDLKTRSLEILDAN
jgi:hypothetical protein